MTEAEIRNLLEYLKTARSLETDLLNLNEIISHQTKNVISLQQKHYPNFCESPEWSNLKPKELFQVGHTGENLGMISGLIIAIVLLIDYWPHAVERYDFWNLLIGFPITGVVTIGIGVGIGYIIGIMIGKAFELPINSKIKAKDNRDLKAAHYKWSENDKRMRNRDTKTIGELNKNISALNKMQDYTKSLRDEHYKDGPIYPTYQTLPAICQLYEYFESGLCTELGDAYRQYRTEEQMNRLIVNSERALEILDNIRTNQLLLYNELRRVKESIDVVNTKLDGCINRLDYISYTNEITAIYTQQTARATHYLAEVEAYKNRNNLPLSIRTMGN
ncbi:MAG: hypothetical protein IJ125_08260 [Atopobiaceae bacterium]|nr:hypothetical protein [Atopobiaceae bacterium]